DDGPVAIGTDNGLAALDQLTGQTYYLNHDPTNPDLSLGGNTVYALLQDKKLNMWVGTGGSGLDRIVLDTATYNYRVLHYRKGPKRSNTIVDDEVLCLLETSDEVLWVGTAQGLSALNPDRTEITNYQREVEDPESLPVDAILCLLELPGGDLLLGTNDGLYRFQRETQRFSRFDTEGRSLENVTVFSMWLDSKGALWVGTDGFGGWQIDLQSHKSIIYDQSFGLPNDIVYGILEDGEQNLWLSTDYGLCCLKRQTDQRQFSVVNYNSENWLPCNDFNIGAHFRNKNGVLFFGCNQGVVYFHHEDFKGNTYLPPVTLTDFQLFFEPVPIEEGPRSVLKQHIGFTESIELNYEQNMLYFEFAALNYIESDKNQYAFYLEGLEDDWNYVRENRSATYTNLDPGEYVFHVKASNNAGVWNEKGTSLRITITPPFYQQVWFYFLCIAGGSALVFLIVLKRTQEARQIRKELERMVQERTREVVAQKDKIEKTNARLEQISQEIAQQRDQVAEKNEELNATLDKLTKTQTKLVASEKMASLGQLTAGVAHEINNPINFVSGNVQPLKRDLNDLLEVLSNYDEVIEEQGLTDRFERVKALKDELDYEFLVQEIGQLIEGIEVGARRTAEIVKGLKNFSRLDENEAKLADLNEGLQSTLLILQNEFKNRVEVVKDFGELPSILCFPGKLNQVFMNILSNAGQAIDGPGKIYLKTWADREFVHISIRDTGKGMKDEVRNHIFEPFFTTKDVGSGTGLGLSISFGIIENHYGTIKVESEMGKGSTFIITLPLRPPEAPDAT
ncbi:MAG: ATP-binding protein, partial [Salibacteraceae bacterium]